MTDIIARYVQENAAHHDGELSWDQYPAESPLEKIPNNAPAMDFIHLCGKVGHDEDVTEAVITDNYPQLAEYLEQMIRKAGCKVVEGNIRLLNYTPTVQT